MTDATTGMIDTNVVIFLDRLDPLDLPAESAISVITLAELSLGPLIARGADERVSRQRRLQETEAMFEPIPFDAAAARAFAGVAASLRKAGRKPTARAFDSLIAATAIANGLSLSTCNPDDFAGIDGLDLRPIPHPDAV